MRINRIYQNDCTVGVLNFGDFRCFTLELPDFNNKQNISCIPHGVYSVEKIVSPSLGACFNIKNVTGRDYIRIHAGNYTSQIQGCVLVGESLADINKDGTPDVTSSKKTLNALLDYSPDNFKLVIE